MHESAIGNILQSIGTQIDFLGACQVGESVGWHRVHFQSPVHPDLFQRVADFGECVIVQILNRVLGQVQTTQSSGIFESMRVDTGEASVDDVELLDVRAELDKVLSRQFLSTLQAAQGEHPETGPRVHHLGQRRVHFHVTAGNVQMVQVMSVALLVFVARVLVALLCVGLHGHGAGHGSVHELRVDFHAVVAQSEAAQVLKAAQHAGGQFGQVVGAEVQVVQTLFQAAENAFGQCVQATFTHREITNASIFESIILKIEKKYYGFRGFSLNSNGSSIQSIYDIV